MKKPGKSDFSLKPESFKIQNKDYKNLKEVYRNLGKNSVVGAYGVEIAMLYLKQQGAREIVKEVNGVDIQAILNGRRVKYEIKSTVDSTLAYSKIKVSSEHCKELLEKGMEILRICNVGRQTVEIYFLKYGRDFTLVQEPRWRVKRLIQ